MTSPRVAVVTGASSGIGAATARALAAEGFHVICAARRTERIEALAADIGGTPVTCDVTNPEDIVRLAEASGSQVEVLVNNAGGAIGLDTVIDGDPADWQRMYDINVIGTLNVTRSLIGALRAAPSGTGTIVNISSTAGHAVYEGGGGYTAAKHALTAMTETLRLELNGEPIRVTEVAPGMVHTEEFSLTRFRGDQQRADQVYAGVDQPLLASDIAETVSWIATRPPHVNVDLLVVKPLAQAAAHKVAKGPLTAR
ncbi:oxidoreductase [Aeromicrobium sp. PE09-221]|uniref:SDR family oxidoreductase n=1 Tax=Aeromicrobium sp. PE09-221 TaxID=1898043 RepID=UPI000B3E8F28|nr:SDR family NAD(P)-dependent oxidoreductase [Aeromicrobium sp. PE09-221]OUZ09105.1 oxidoreductase [Aeromicrobium sp. PE09-221]